MGNWWISDAAVEKFNEDEKWSDSGCGSGDRRSSRAWKVNLQVCVFFFFFFFSRLFSQYASCTLDMRVIEIQAVHVTTDEWRKYDEVRWRRGSYVSR